MIMNSNLRSGDVLDHQPLLANQRSHSHVKVGDVEEDLTVVRRQDVDNDDHVVIGEASSTSATGTSSSSSAASATTSTTASVTTSVTLPNHDVGIGSPNLQPSPSQSFSRSTSYSNAAPTSTSTNDDDARSKNSFGGIGIGTGINTTATHHHNRIHHHHHDVVGASARGPALSSLSAATPSSPGTATATEGDGGQQYHKNTRTRSTPSSSSSTSYWCPSSSLSSSQSSSKGSSSSSSSSFSLPSSSSPSSVRIARVSISLALVFVLVAQSIIHEQSQRSTTTDSVSDLLLLTLSLSQSQSQSQSQTESKDDDERQQSYSAGVFTSTTTNVNDTAASPSTLVQESTVSIVDNTTRIVVVGDSETNSNEDVTTESLHESTFTNKTTMLLVEPSSLPLQQLLPWEGKNKPVNQRYDESGPRTIINGSRTFTALPCLPRQYRDYFGGTDEHTKTSPLFVYNPSIVPLPPKLRSSLVFTDGDQQMGTPAEPTYLISFRVSAVNGCGINRTSSSISGSASVPATPKSRKEKRQLRKEKKLKNFLGLAVLDRQLRIIPNSDVIMDFVSVFKKYSSSTSGKPYEDFRLVHVPSVANGHIANNKNDDDGGRIFLTHRVFFAQIHLSTTKSHQRDGNNEDNDDKNNNNKSQLPMIEVPPLFGGNPHLQDKSNGLDNITTNGLTVHVIDIEKKSFINDIPPDGKNFGLLPSLAGGGGDGGGQDGSNSGKLFLEYSIDYPRQTFEIDLSTYEASPMTTHSYGAPEPSFLTQYQALIDVKFTTQDRGTSCCVKLSTEHFHDWTTNRTIHNMDHLWVGVGHTKNRQRMEPNGFQYVSRLYALSPTYDLVARSGLFCVGFPNDDGISTTTTADAEAGVDLDVHVVDPLLVNQTRKSKLMFASTTTTTTRTTTTTATATTYNCPRIEFVSGISEKVDDYNVALLAYGINDCVSNIVQVPKEQLGRRLFGNME
mmetsp:Transcript_49783/g.120671  ORF Transcript_49783/g.120671 Transcript_49783/m.120671 type:complete len:956 (+) Transcript_49783:51-2918(+)